MKAWGAMGLLTSRLCCLPRGSLASCPAFPSLCAARQLPACRVSGICGCHLPAHAAVPLPRPFPAADLDKGAIIATATLFVELKFIRGCSKCGHIEDVVVDSTYRGLRLGLRVIEALMAAAEVRSGAGQECSNGESQYTGACRQLSCRRGSFGASGLPQGSMAHPCCPGAGGGLLQGDPGLQRGERALL